MLYIKSMNSNIKKLTALTVCLVIFAACAGNGEGTVEESTVTNRTIERLEAKLAKERAKEEARMTRKGKIDLDTLAEGVSSMEELEARAEALEAGIRSDKAGKDSSAKQENSGQRKEVEEVRSKPEKQKKEKAVKEKKSKAEIRAERKAKRAARRKTAVEEPQNDSIPVLGFWEEDYIKEVYTVQSGETFSGAMGRLGLSATDAYNLVQVSDTLFDVRKFRAGNVMNAYFSGDSLCRQLEYLVYVNDRVKSTIFKCKDSLAVWTYEKPVIIRNRYSDITIEESLWNDMIKAGASPLLIVDLADVYAWTVDFFTLREGDRFRAFYTEKVVDDEVFAIDRIQYCLYNRGAYEINAVYYDQGDGGNKYWNEKGESMKKAFLKAPLKFNRVSSKFTYHRKHPISGVVKPHTGVDYAAPAGTPVRTIGDGTVVSAGWGGAGGNTIKIKHNSVYTTAYLHLKGFAKGIKAGAKVHQGDVIGYVGSTGASTGPHLDFRVWKNGSPIDPLKMESPSADPAKKENLPAIDSLFHVYRSQIDSLNAE